MNTIRYSIDAIELINEREYLVISGWVYAESKKKVNIQVIGEENIILERMERPDIYHEFKMHNSALNTGFKITMPYSDKVSVKFSTSNEKLICKFKSTDGVKHQKGANKFFRLFHIFSFATMKKMFIYLREYGVLDTFRKIKSKFIKQTHKNIKYDDWFERTRPSLRQIDKQKKKIFEYSPMISIICILEENNPKYFSSLIQSLVKQTYINWELLILNKTNDDVKLTISNEYKVLQYDDSMNMAGNLNKLANEAKGEYLSIVEGDSIIEVNSLYEIVKSLNNDKNLDLIYVDEDEISLSEKGFCNPFFKEDWAPDTLRSRNYIGNFAFYRKDFFLEVGGYNEEFFNSYLYDLYFRMVEKTNKIYHISKVLYHSRERENKTINKEEDIRSILNHVTRIGYKATVKEGLLDNTYKVDYAIEGNPLVSIIIPNKDEKDTLKKCINSIIEKSTYKNVEIIIVENNSTTEEIFEYYNEVSKIDNVRVIIWEKEFNYSAINNFGVKESHGEYILLLNNDIEVITENWIEEMIMHNQREEVGITGVKLYYPDNEIQHAGVILGIRGVAGHSHGHFNREDDGYQGRLKVVQNLSAVTAACLMVRRNVFDEVNGFDVEFPVAFNDVDFCMRVREKGYLIIFTPFVEMYHYESKSRGEDTTPEKARRFELEVHRFREKWGIWSRDPYYNDNLTLDEEDFSLRI